MLMDVEDRNKECDMMSDANSSASDTAKRWYRIDVPDGCNSSNHSDSQPTQTTNHALEELVVTLGQQLGQPLTAIVNYAEACRQNAMEGSAAGIKELLGCLEDITDQALHAGKIIRQFRFDLRQRSEDG